MKKTTTTKSDIIKLSEKYGVKVVINDESKVANIDLEVFEHYLSKMQKMQASGEQTSVQSLDLIANNSPENIQRSESKDFSVKSITTQSSDMTLLCSLNKDMSLKDVNPLAFANGEYDPGVHLFSYYYVYYDNLTARYIHHYDITYRGQTSISTSMLTGNYTFECIIKQKFLGVVEHNPQSFTAKDELTLTHLVNGYWNATIVGNLEAKFAYTGGFNGTIEYKWIPIRTEIVI